MVHALDEKVDAPPAHEGQHAHVEQKVETVIGDGDPEGERDQGKGQGQRRCDIDACKDEGRRLADGHLRAKKKVEKVQRGQTH